MSQNQVPFRLKNFKKRRRKKINSRKHRLKKGIFLLPNLLTTGGLFAGFYSIIAAINNDFFWSSLAILFAIVLDGLDGAVARKTRTTSSFGVQYDSMCDLVTFAIAPSLLIYIWALTPFGRIGWLAAFVFSACGALRLARFNTMANSGKTGGDFRGLPVPAAAGLIASFVCLLENTTYKSFVPMESIAVVAYVLSFLMVSTIRYKKIDIFNRRLKYPFRTSVSVILILFMAAAAPKLMTFVVMALFCVSGPVTTIFKNKKEIKSTEDVYHQNQDREQEKSWNRIN
ncbi:MAG: CDP-diacylglycerol--serine O-phosphatidyltransferase [Nitrospinota bacterium]|nr:CDP-diacylglycerol--serine O-phosphatidyltransferase [Nitrospinota bacterium]